jgi:hypothetical protein
VRGIGGDHAALDGYENGRGGHGPEDREQIRLEVGHPDVRAGDSEELALAVRAVVGDRDRHRDHVPVGAGEVDVRAVDVGPTLAPRDGEPVHVEVVVQVDGLGVQVQPDPREPVGAVAGPGPLPPLKVPGLARDHAGGGHDPGPVGSGQHAEVVPDDLPHAGQPVGREHGPRGEAGAPLRHEAVTDRRDGSEHSLKHRPDLRGRLI